MIYEIQIDYSTGDSFHTERIYGEPLGIVNENLDNATENLNRIQKHWKKYGNKGYNDDAYELDMVIDDGSVRTITPFWIGYFEKLHGAKIVMIEGDNMSFET